MKNFFQDILVQLMSLVAVFSSIVLVLCIMGLFVGKHGDIISILGGAIFLLFLSVFYLRLKKITWVEFLALIIPW